MTVEKSARLYIELRLHLFNVLVKHREVRKSKDDVIKCFVDEIKNQVLP